MTVPKWPALRGTKLDTHSIKRLKDSEIWTTFFTIGTHIVNAYPNGGFGTWGGTPTEYPCVSFEVKSSLHSTAVNRKTPLYLITWLGMYAKGCVWHAGWQYPRVLDFKPQEIAQSAANTFLSVAEVLYDGDVPDAEVRRFAERYDFRF